MRKFLFRLFIFLLLITGVLAFVLFTGRGKVQENMKWGVTFSVPQAQYLKLPWQTVYVSLLDDIKVRNFRLIAEWDTVEVAREEFDFSTIDWQLKELQKRNGKAIVTLGMKVPRWPECHIPRWAESLTKSDQQDAIVKYIEKSVRHLSVFDNISAWQIENEPLFPFGECPWHTDKDFLKREIAAVKAIDNLRPILVTGSGEGTLLFTEASVGDVVGTTLYRRVYFDPLSLYLGYPFSSASYARKVWLIKKIYDKEIINIELQAEPWSEGGLLNAEKEENDNTFTLGNFRNNIEFALHAGHKEAYLWGAEWWYFMKESGHPEFWDEAKKLFR